MNNKNFQIILITIVFFLVVVGSGLLFYKYLTNNTNSLSIIEQELQSYQVELEKCKEINTEQDKASCEKYVSKIERKLKEYEARLSKIQQANLSATVNFGTN